MIDNRENFGRSRLWLFVGAFVVLSIVLVASARADAPAWRVLAATGPTNLPPTSSEVQEVSIDATGGSFTLTFDGQTTGALVFDATEAEVANALNALSSVGGVAGVVEVSGAGGTSGDKSPFAVRFRGSFAGDDVPQMSGDSSQLTGGSASVAVTTEVEGGEPGEGTLAVYATNVGGSASVGTTTATVGPLPAGIETSGSASGKGWTCSPSGPGQVLINCTRLASVPAFAGIDPITVPLRVAGAVAPDASVLVAVDGGGASPDLSERNTYRADIAVSEAKVKPGVQAFWAGAFDADGAPATQAGGHPNVAGTMFLVNTNLSTLGDPIVAGDPKDIQVDLPPGFIGNPMVSDRCPRNQPGGPGSGSPDVLCSASSSSIGGASTLTREFGAEVIRDEVLNGVPPTGYAARFTFKIVEGRGTALASVRSDEDFGVTVSAPNIPTAYMVFGSLVMLEGNPPAAGGRAFLTNPTDCAHEALSAPITTIASNSWQQPTLFDDMTVGIPPVVDCAALEFKPEFTFQPVSESAATGTAATAELSVDQAGLLDPDELAPPHLKKSVVTLPEGMVLNPAAADGLEACSTKQMGLKGTGFAAPNPIRFDMNPVSCPDGSKIGTAEVVTPLLEKPLAATLYLAAQDDNPFKSLLAMYIVVEDEETGLVIKLPGLVTPDPKTGQLTATFDNNPQTPFSSLKLNFRGGGPWSTMATPDVCSKYTTKGSFTPWSAPESGPPATTEDSFTIQKGVGNSAACPQTKAQRPFALGFEAGSTNPVAGGHSPFTLRITRPDGNQELDKVSVTTPPGFAATLKGVTTCSDGAVAAAGAADRTGKAEIANPSCPASSQIGTTTIGAGVGSNPFYVKTGKVYLTGPYKGAPLSFAFIVPAVAGPFDLGVQVVRTALRINPVNAQITAESDPIPQILKGIPLQIRDVRVDIDRPGFTLNPTNCEAMSVAGQVTGGSGAVANVNSRFQVGNCGALGFKPNVQIQLHGGTKRGKYQRVVATVTAREGDANIARAAVTFPHSAFLAQEHLDKICTRVQFAAKACPARSIYGYATAITPLLDEPVQGPVYLRSNPEHELPDLVAALRGPDRLPIEVELQGRTDSKNEGIRNTFDIVPDVAVTKFTMQIKGGNHALIVNSRDLCKGKKQKASVRLNAQNGKVRNFQTVVKNDCGKKKGNGGKGKKSSAGKRGRGSSSQARLHR